MKKLNKLFAILVAMAMVLSLGVVSAFAAEGEVRTADNFKIKKVLQMPDGTTTPTVDFKFTVTASTVPNETAASTPAAAQNLKISFPGTAQQSAADENGVVTVTGVIEAADIFTGTYEPGKYVYYLSEVDEATANSVNGAKYTYDGTQYRIHLYVDAQKNKHYTLEVKAPDSESFEKDSTEGTGADEAYVADFTNKYVYTEVVTPDGNDPPTNDAKGFALEKLVDGDDGGLYTSTPFTFNVRVEAAPLSEKTEYTYDIVKVKKDAEETLVKVKENQKIAVSKTTTTPIELKTGERLVFKDLDVGAKVYVNETAHADFNKAALLNNATYTEDSVIDIEQADNEYLKYTNTYNKGSTGPEGILISNLPYIALALVAIGGLVAYVVIRRRNADEA